MKARSGRPVRTIPNLSTGKLRSFDGPKSAKAIVEVKKHVTN